MNGLSGRSGKLPRAATKRLERESARDFYTDRRRKLLNLHLSRGPFGGADPQFGPSGECCSLVTPCEEIQTRMLEVCQKIAEDHGLVIEDAGWRGADTGFSFEPVFRVSIPASDGTAFNLEKDRFEFLAQHFGLAPSDSGREFCTGSERFLLSRTRRGRTAFH